MVVSLASSTLVETGLWLATRFSKLPPLTPLMLVLTGAWPLPVSLLTATLTEPELWPTAMVMILPLARVTNTGLPVTGALIEAV
ncbi:hypothetical protein PSRE111525_12450 [Pseudomonas reidholzensis]